MILSMIPLFSNVTHNKRENDQIIEARECGDILLRWALLKILDNKPNPQLIQKSYELILVLIELYSPDAGDIKDIAASAQLCVESGSFSVGLVPSQLQTEDLEAILISAVTLFD